MPRKTKTRTKTKGKPHAVVETRGRKTLLTPELQAEIEQILKEGHYQSVAIDIVGVSSRAYYYWLEQGEAAEIKQESGESLTDNETLYLQFLQTVKKARAYGIRHDINLISKAGQDGSWQALAWKRERMNPELFALRGRVDVNQNINHNVNINHDIKVELSNANAGTVLDIMAECGAIPPPDRELE